MSESVAKLRFRRDHHWAPERMSAHLDGELPAPQSDRMERHLGECPECHRLFAGLTAVVDALHNLQAARPGWDMVQFVASVRVRCNQPPDALG